MFDSQRNFLRCSFSCKTMATFLENAPINTHSTWNGACCTQERTIADSSLLQTKIRQMVSFTTADLSRLSKITWTKNQQKRSGLSNSLHVLLLNPTVHTQSQMNLCSPQQPDLLLSVG